ncbi:hypothetical protein [Methylobacterium oxalidis]|uniref:Uncharacterized protein n=1 Tax=Methylobacterium oxalidis TaxID=944322 RepID=A0A512IYI4_9HYPH|nr:hypothetical protein [Methylobacterium oxalidis]GEP02770.1 hypothetical protein MOX02_08080 [Methylobacterium oxalidis]GJE34265.1 hypothetical protein LDDCCGHA_4474 [Methylobacterium oxalidis]GLS66830.1 hypothetical protein GCM10007888_52130 [Methylobacterium oxalidis]
MRTRPILPAAVKLPPIMLRTAAAPRPAPAFALAPLRRSLFCLAALALPVLGTGLADQVHRAARPGTQQAAAPLTPSRGAAAPDPGRPGAATRLALETRWHP